MVLSNDKILIFGGIPSGSTAPIFTLHEFDPTSLTWSIPEPPGEDRPHPRMWQSMYKSGQSIMIYGGINCYQTVVVTTEEGGSRQYEFSTNTLEYQYAMEDIWTVDKDSFTWVELKPARTRRKTTCPDAENTEPIDNWKAFDYSYDESIFSTYPGVLAFAGVLFVAGYLVVRVLEIIAWKNTAA